MDLCLFQQKNGPLTAEIVILILGTIQKCYGFTNKNVGIYTVFWGGVEDVKKVCFVYL